VSLFRFESGFLCGSGRFGWLPFPRNYQCAADELGETLLGQVTVAALTPHVTGDNADASLSSELGRELVEKPRALIVAERSRRGNVPEDLNA
jgi:hypothetical protein